MIRGGDIAKGTVLLNKGTPYLVVEREFVNPGKGAAFARVKMKNFAGRFCFDADDKNSRHRGRRRGRHA